jgi:hypothetical protein
LFVPCHNFVPSARPRHLAQSDLSPSCTSHAPRGKDIFNPVCLALVYSLKKAMIFSKDYIGYLARQTVKHLVDAKMIETAKPAVLNERVTAAMVDELALEDRINDEVRVILEAFQEDMRKTGASYPEMFKKVKNELARKYKAVL